MLRQLTLQNFRCFENHSLSFQTHTVLVGKNNAGKSSIVEALQLLAAVVNRKSAAFVAPPAELGLREFRSCIRPKVSHLDLALGTIFHRYNDPPAVLTGVFERDTTVTVYVSGPETVCATVQARKNWIISTHQLRQLALPWIYVLPQVGPLQIEEYLLDDSYVAEKMFSNLSSRHFRNQLSRHPVEFVNFKRLAESTWPGLRVDPVERRVDKKGALLSLMVRDGDFVGEVGLMGHGLQMWLQTIWFVSRVPAASIIVLDEPDVYMHPDLQRKLSRSIAGRFEQSIVATHSVEVMAEADPGEILVVDRTRRRSRYANTEPGVQLLIDQIGGIHNVHLARLWSCRRFLLVEGKDLALLRRFHSLLCPGAELPIDALPSLAIGGWGGWARAVGSSLAMKNAVGEQITVYCILDRDYHTDAQVDDRLAEAKAVGVQLHIWSAKEIENFLLNPSAIHRIIANRTGTKPAPSPNSVWNEILAICETLKNTVIDGVAAEIQKSKRVDLVAANREAREHVKCVWEDVDRRVAAVPGTEVLSRLSEWAQREFHVAFGPPAVARRMTRAEVPAEVVWIVEAIERGVGFSP